MFILSLAPEISLLANPKLGSVGALDTETLQQAVSAAEVGNNTSLSIQCSTTRALDLGAALGNGCCSVPRVKLISPPRAMGLPEPRLPVPHSPVQHGHALCWQPEKQAMLREMLQTTHPKHCQFFLVTGFYLLCELVGAVGIEEADGFAHFLATLTGLPFLQPLLTERHGQGALQARSATRRRYICRSQRKPLNMGGGRAFHHVFLEEPIWPL